MKKLSKILMFTNIMTPYRKVFYNNFYRCCKENNIDFKILVMANSEKERHWDYDDYKTDFSELMHGYHFIISSIETHINTGILKQINEYNPDIIIVVGGYMLLTNLFLVIRRKSVDKPLIYWNESHLDEVRNYNPITLKIREYIRNYYFQKISGFWYSGAKSKELINKYRKANSTLYFIPNLIENTVYYPISTVPKDTRNSLKLKFGLPLDKTVMICPARLNKVKGIHVFMDVLKNVKNRSKICVIVAGDGEMLDYLENKARELQLDFRFLGYKHQNELIQLYEASDIFLLPSLSDPNPLTVIEALWGGMPLIVTKHVGNYPEAVKEGVNGVVLDYSNMEECSQKVEAMISINDVWKKKAKETSLNIAKSIYNPDIVIEKAIKEMKKDFSDGKMILF